MINLKKYYSILNGTSLETRKGFVAEIIGYIVYCYGPQASMGELCSIKIGRERIPAEVVGFKENKTLLMPLGNFKGIRPGSEVIALGHFLKVNVSNHLVGRVLDGLGEPLDDLDKISGTCYPLENNPPIHLDEKG